MNSILFLFAALLVSIPVLAWALTQKKIRRLRASGDYPREGQETDADVARLAKAGESALAVRCYRHLHKVGLKEAHDAVLGRAATKAQPYWLMVAGAFVLVLAVLAFTR
jgi:hypothetical protein